MAFVVSWAPYGGPDEETVLPLFGLTCQQLQERFPVIVSNLTISRHLRLNFQQRELLKSAVKLLPLGEAEYERECSTVALPGEWVARRGLRYWRPRRAQQTRWRATPTG